MPRPGTPARDRDLGQALAVRRLDQRIAPHLGGIADQHQPLAASRIGQPQRQAWR